MFLCKILSERQISPKTGFACLFRKQAKPGPWLQIPHVQRLFAGGNPPAVLSAWRRAFQATDNIVKPVDKFLLIAFSQKIIQPGIEVNADPAHISSYPAAFLGNEYPDCPAILGIQLSFHQVILFQLVN